MTNYYGFMHNARWNQIFWRIATHTHALIERVIVNLAVHFYFDRLVCLGFQKCRFSLFLWFYSVKKQRGDDIQQRWIGVNPYRRQSICLTFDFWITLNFFSSPMDSYIWTFKPFNILMHDRLPLHTILWVHLVKNDKDSF